MHFTWKPWPVLSGAAAALSLGALIALTPACGDDEPPATLEDAGIEAGAEPEPPPPRTPSDGGGANEPPVIEVDCPAGTAVEVEDNGTPEKASELDQQLSFCGALSPGSDVDYSKFETPPGKKLALFQGVIEGAVDFDLMVNGKTLRPGDVKKFEAGKYIVKAYTKDGKPGKYRYRIQFEP